MRREIEVFTVHRLGGEDLALEPLFLTADSVDVISELSARFYVRLTVTETWLFD